jgi:hypothetical protein
MQAIWVNLFLLLRCVNSCKIYCKSTTYETVFKLLVYHLFNMALFSIAFASAAYSQDNAYQSEEEYDFEFVKAFHVMGCHDSGI